MLIKYKDKTPRITLNDLMKEIKSIKAEFRAEITKINIRLYNIETILEKNKIDGILKRNNLQ